MHKNAIRADALEGNASPTTWDNQGAAMLCAKFAELCGLSRMMVSKYKGMGLIAFVDDLEKHVDPEESLRRMAGRFNELKRQAALARLAEYRVIEAQATTGMPLPLAGPKPNLTPPKAEDAQSPAKVLSAKQQKDYYEAGLKRLEYMRRAGELLSTAEVATQAELAISAMREVFSNAKRDAAKDFCAAFDIPPDRETAVTRKLGDAFEKALGRFAEAARKMADQGMATPDQVDDGLPGFEPGELGL
jgi:hypothetical protein